MQVQETLSARILTVTLYVLFGVVAAVILTLPLLLDFYMRFFYDGFAMIPEYRRFITIFLRAVGVLGEWILLEVIRMMHTIPTGPFVNRNTRALCRVGVLSMVMAALFFFKCFHYNTFFTLIFGVVLVLCGLIAFTLCGLFRQAVAYREENDLTI